MTPPRGLLPRSVRERYHAARRERAAANGATKDGACATDTDIRGQLHQPPDEARPSEGVREPTPLPSSQIEPEAPPEPKRSLSRRALSLAILVGAIIACAAVGIVLGSVVSSTGDDDAPGTTATVRTRPEPQPQAPKRATRPASIALAAGGAFDPLGDGDEHAEEVPLAVDGDASTAWSSEDYQALNKAGVGFYVDAERPVLPTELQIRTPTPGFSLAVYGAHGEHAPRALAGWTKLGEKAKTKRETPTALDAHGQRYGLVLVWITSLPPGGGAVKIADVRLRAQPGV